MKHNLRITLILLALFFVTQIFGLTTISKNIEVTQDTTGATVIVHEDTIVGQPPKTQSGVESIVVLTLAIIIGTALILLLMKLKIRKLFKYWYLLAVLTTMAVTLGVYITWFSENMNTFAVIALASLFAWLKVFKNNIFIHNITEVFVYSGIAVLFVSLFEGWLWAAFVLLIIISLYDMFAVWQSKHMIKMANYQTENKVFAGLSIPYHLPKKKTKTTGATLKKSKMAILGGGDLAFPLLFAGSVMSHLILSVGLDKISALYLSSVIAVTTAIALFLLLTLGKKDRFYPAMPFLSAGCFLGYGIITLLI